MKGCQLEKYLSDGVARMIKDIGRLSSGIHKRGIFVLQLAAVEKRARMLRERFEKEGEHIPPFLIASITNQCNLKCRGCYDRANHECGPECSKKELTAGQWSHIFEQAEKLGVFFILLAGGEPLVRRDVLKEAAGHRNILFPIFTNGTMIDREFLEMVSSNQNLLPVLSIEGREEATDQRRGTGVYSRLKDGMKKLKQQDILFGASITVTKDNMTEVSSGTFIEELNAWGCKAVIYVEYVPIDRTTAHLAFGDKERKEMEAELMKLRKAQTDMIFLSFPGDESVSGGCLAAGRGFFHINAAGGAEPCPFSPYSDTSLLNTSLRDALSSPLFHKIRTEDALKGAHSGGCVLFEKEAQVRRLLEG